LTYMTAWQMLIHRARLRRGETVLINAIGSGVGCAALRIAKAHGAMVIGTASTAAKRKRALGEGADYVLPYSSGLSRAVRRLTGGRGADVVVDSVGASILAASVDAIAIGGRFSSCGATADARVQIDLHVLQEKRTTFFFTVMGSSSDLFDSVRTIEMQKL